MTLAKSFALCIRGYIRSLASSKGKYGLTSQKSISVLFTVNQEAVQKLTMRTGKMLIRERPETSGIGIRDDEVGLRSWHRNEEKFEANLPKKIVGGMLTACSFTGGNC